MSLVYSEGPATVTTSADAVLVQLAPSGRRRAAAAPSELAPDQARRIATALLLGARAVEAGSRA